MAPFFKLISSKKERTYNTKTVYGIHETNIPLAIREKVKEPISPLEFGFIDDLPDYFTRMQAVRRTIKNEGIKDLPTKQVEQQSQY